MKNPAIFAALVATSLVSSTVHATETIEMVYEKMEWESAAHRGRVTPTDQVSFGYTEIEWEYSSSAIEATFDVAACTLWVDGNDDPNVISISADDGGRILVNGGEIPIVGGQPTVDDGCLISVHGGGGNDLLVDTSRLGAELEGGDGLDVLLWDDTAAFEVRHTFADAPSVNLDLGLIVQPGAVSEDDVVVDGRIITAEDWRAAASHFDGKLLTARDLTSEQTSFEPSIDGDETFLTYDGGYSTVAVHANGHEGTIEILSWSWGDTGS